MPASVASSGFSRVQWRASTCAMPATVALRAHVARSRVSADRSRLAAEDDVAAGVADADDEVRVGPDEALGERRDDVDGAVPLEQVLEQARGPVGVLERAQRPLLERDGGGVVVAEVGFDVFHCPASVARAGQWQIAQKRGKAPPVRRGGVPAARRRAVRPFPAPGCGASSRARAPARGCGCRSPWRAAAAPRSTTCRADATPAPDRDCGRTPPRARRDARRR